MLLAVTTKRLPARRKPRFCGASVSAPREIRTPTDQMVHKALNLARLPVPPQARAGAQYRAALQFGPRRLDAVRTPRYSTNTCSRDRDRAGSDRREIEGSWGGSNGRAEADQAPAGDLRLHQAVRVGARLSTDGAGHRQGHWADLLVDRP